MARPGEAEAQKARAELCLRGRVALSSLLTSQSHTAARFLCPVAWGASIPSGYHLGMCA